MKKGLSKDKMKAVGSSGTEKDRIKAKSGGEKHNAYQREMAKIADQIPSFGDAFFSTSVEDRTQRWNEMDNLWDPLCAKYAWACPDNRALKVLCHFSPLIEIGAGKGYWAHLVQQKGGDIIAFDKHAGEGDKPWTSIEQGGPEVLLAPSMSEKNLFLCFPDEEESIAIVCLENFTGEYIIHVGELMAGDGTCGASPQAPWGRTSSAEFQIALASSFHCLYVARLETRLPFARDCISVWRRTTYVQGRNFPDQAEGGSNSDSDEDDDEDDEDGEGDDDDDDYDDEDENAQYSEFNRSYFANLHEQEKMLADRVRMDFYHAAIKRCIKPGDVAIDLGTGTGILAAFAEQRGAAKVFAIDHSRSILDIAKKVAAANNITKVEYVRKHSSEFRLDGDKKVDVIIHEQMGDCLFDEDMVKNVCDIRDRLLKPGGLILPSTFDLFVEPVKLDDMRHVPFIWDLQVHGIDFSCMRSDKKRQDDDYYHLRSCDPSLVDYFLGTPKPAYSVDLGTLVEAEMPTSLAFSKKIVTAGRFDAFVVYFRASAGEDLSLATGPHDEERAPHWGYRILRGQSEHFKVGDTMDISLEVESWPDLNSWRWGHVKRVKGEEGKDDKPKSKSSKTAHDVPSVASSAVSLMSMSDLAKLRGEAAPYKGAAATASESKVQTKGAPAASSSSSSSSNGAVSFMSMSDLARLRQGDGSKETRKRKIEHVEKEQEEQEEEVEEEHEEEEEEEGSKDGSTALQSRRERDLDRQYAETDDKNWAYVLQGEMMPDRAVVSLQFLL